MLQELWPLPSFSDRHRQRQQKAIATRKNGVLHSSNGEKKLTKGPNKLFLILHCYTNVIQWKDEEILD